MAVITGTNGNDGNLNGTTGNDLILGYDGDDRLTGFHGNDTLDGGNGDDTFVANGDGWVEPLYDQPNGGRTTFFHARDTYGPRTGDIYLGGNGLDTVVAGENNLTMVLDDVASLAQDSVEAVSAGGFGSFRVAVLSNAPQDFTRINLENVTLDFGYGDDVITGSSAYQEYDSNGDGIVDGGTNNNALGNDLIDGGHGTDTVNFTGNRADYFIEYLGGNQFRVLDLNTADGDTGDDHLTNVEHLQFTDGTLDLAPIWQDMDATGGNAVDGVAGVVSETAGNGASVGIDLSVQASADLLALVPGAANVTYALVDSLGGMFAIDPVTGIVTVANANLLDYETAPILPNGTDHGYTITVQASAGGVNVTRTFTILVTDAEENVAPNAPVDIDASANSVNEGAATGTYTGVHAFASDANTADTVTYSLTNNAGGRFSIGADGRIYVANGALLDFEAQAAWNVTVRAIDSTGLSTSSIFTISLADVVGDTPADSDNTANSVAENAAAGTYTGVTALLVSPTGASVTYSLVDNAGGRFQIDPTTGVVSVLDGSRLDFEARSAWNITVRANDGLISGTQIFTINLTNGNDAPGLLSDWDSTTNQVSEGAPTGSLVGITVHATDPDGDAVTYSLLDDAGGRFRIHATTGVITVADGTLLDFETQSAWNVIVRATDTAGLYRDGSITINLADVSLETWSGTSGNDSYTLTSRGEWTLRGLDGNDILTATDGANVTFIGGTGNDTLEGRNGNDIFEFAGTAGGLDAVSGGDGYDIISATASNTTIGLSALSGVEEISGGGFANVSIQLGGGNDVINSNVTTLTGIAAIRAGAGHDTVIGTYGNESIFGEDGNDIIWGGYGADILNGGNGIDTLSYEGNWTGVTVNLATNTVSGGDADGDTISLFENVIGSDNNDVITGSTAANVITGGAGDDAMDGGGGNDTFRIGLNSGIDAIIGGSGTDTVLFTENDAVLALSSLATVEIFNAAGITNATITGNELDNTLNFGSATMTNIAGIFGLDGNDIITGSAGSDIIIGGAGDDTLNGGNGNDVFRYDGGDEGFDALNGGGGIDTVEASAAGVVIGLRSITAIEAINGMGDTIIQGSAAANTLNFSTVTLTGIAAIDGGDGNDTITGSIGDDAIYGGNGADRLTGGNGYDYLMGNAGNDIFDFNFVGESSVGSWSDIIGDFVKGQDKVDVTTIDANTALAGDQNFSFIGGGAFTNVAGQLRYDNTIGDGYTHVFGDVNGDGVADFQIRLQGTYTLATADFVL